MDTDGLEFTAVHDQYRPRVRRYLTALVGETDAEDLTQAVMLKVNRGLPGFRGDANLATWILRIAKNTALDELRRKKIEWVLEVDRDVDECEDDENLQQPSAESVETVTIRHETSACVRAYIERLPDNYKGVMLLSEIEGFTNDEIAAALGLSTGTVKIRLHRAREKLREALEAGCRFDRGAGGELGCDPKPPAS